MKRPSQPQKDRHRCRLLLAPRCGERSGSHNHPLPSLLSSLQTVEAHHLRPHFRHQGDCPRRWKWWDLRGGGERSSWGDWLAAPLLEAAGLALRCCAVVVHQCYLHSSQ